MGVIKVTVTIEGNGAMSQGIIEIDSVLREASLRAERFTFAESLPVLEYVIKEHRKNELVAQNSHSTVSVQLQGVATVASTDDGPSGS